MKVFGIGHAMVDIFCSNWTEDVSFPHPLNQNEIIHITPPEMDALLASLEAANSEFSALSQKNCVSGGTAANILKAAAALGADCTFYGAMGTINGERDDNSLFFQKELGAYGVKSFLTSESEPTGRFLMVKTATGRFAGAASPAAARKLTVFHVPQDALKAADFAVIEGMVCMNGSVFARLLDLCAQNNVIPVIDAASLFAAQNAVVPAVLAFAAKKMPLFLFANEDEAVAISNAAGETFEIFAQKLCASHCRTVVVKKLSERGVQAWLGGDFFSVPAQAKTALDATGAGDMFAGAFLSAYISLCADSPAAKNKIPDAEQFSAMLAFANRTASIVLNSFGCRFEPSSLRSFNYWYQECF